MKMCPNQVTAPNCRQALHFRRVGFFGSCIRWQRSFPAAVGEFWRWAASDAMKRFWPLIFIIAGLVQVFVGFFYYAITEGVPDQDPTPAMAARAARHEHISNLMLLCGCVVIGVGAIAAVSVGIFRTFRSSVASRLSQNAPQLFAPANAVGRSGFTIKVSG